MNSGDRGASPPDLHVPELRDSNGDELPETIARHAGIGMVLFTLYLAFYAGFVLISAFQPEWMAVRPGEGVNLAIWYGFGLIGLALVLAVIYSWLCRARDGS